MGNMSYCRFENTLDALRDCYNNMGDDDLSKDEQEAKQELIQLCVEIAGNWGDEDEDEI